MEQDGNGAVERSEPEPAGCYEPPPSSVIEIDETTTSDSSS
jgi:hypothetical protein